MLIAKHLFNAPAGPLVLHFLLAEWGAVLIPSALKALGLLNDVIALRIAVVCDYNDAIRETLLAGDHSFRFVALEFDGVVAFRSAVLHVHLALKESQCALKCLSGYEGELSAVQRNGLVIAAGPRESHLTLALSSMSDQNRGVTGLRTGMTAAWNLVVAGLVTEVTPVVWGWEL
jgi:hypothetical protein